MTARGPLPVQKRRKHKYYGRFNQGVVTINLVDVACLLSRGRYGCVLEDSWMSVWSSATRRSAAATSVCSEPFLMCAPILWQYGALARLKKGETIDKLLFNNYSTISSGLCRSL
jgi:hypothetical protein